MSDQFDQNLRKAMKGCMKILLTDFGKEFNKKAIKLIDGVNIV